MPVITSVSKAAGSFSSDSSRKLLGHFLTQSQFQSRCACRCQHRPAQAGHQSGHQPPRRTHSHTALHNALRTLLRQQCAQFQFCDDRRSPESAVPAARGQPGAAPGQPVPAVAAGRLCASNHRCASQGGTLWPQPRNQARDRCGSRGSQHHPTPSVAGAPSQVCC
jgi:hypothetical protein